MKRPYCDFCGDCCRGLGEDFGIEIEPADADRMAAFLGLSREAFLAQYTYTESLDEDGNEVVHYLHDNQGQCVLLQNNRCTVHAAKPMQCYLGWPDRAFVARQENPRNYPCVELDGPELLYVR